ncbi:hypothetical protein EIP86_011289 [Pleurotus ostreatoroseus]|nr:hypothetical protein EIP86_011289 [Pleurotus ostreatoroseus]
MSLRETRSSNEKYSTEVHEPPWLIRLPMRLVQGAVASGYSLFRPYAPQMVPLMAFAITIPILVFFSLSAGWLVWRSIAVSWETNLYLQYGDGKPPYAQVQLPPLVSQQPYDISLHLIVPANTANYELGNFMTTLTLSTPSNKTVASVRRAALVLPPMANPLSFMLGQMRTIQLNVPMISSMEPGVNTLIAQVELGRRDQWKTIGNGEGRELSVLSALLRGVVVHEGFRGLMTRFPLLTALTASGTFFFVSFIILAACLLSMVELRTPEEAPTAEDTAEKTPRVVKREESVPRRSRRSRSATVPRRRSRSSPDVRSEESQTEEVKTEEIVTTIPQASSSTESPLRRRRSRLSQPEVDQ